MRGTSGDAVNILLVDDHELFREGLKLLLADLAPALEFAEAADCASALTLARARRFDIVLMDFHLPGTGGLQVLQALRAAAEAAAIVVLSAEEAPALIRQVIEERAAGFIPKSSSHAVMMAALRLILAGGTYLPPHALYGSAAAPAPLPTLPTGSVETLTERQLTTLRLAIQGKANKTIARELGLSEATVKAHLSAAFRVLGVRNRTEAVFAVARNGLEF